MFRISPSFKDHVASAAGTVTVTTTATVTATDPVTIWAYQYNFAFPPALSVHETNYTIDNTRLRVIHDVPRPNTTLYRLLSQYNPWLDCEMTREKRVYLKPRSGELCYPVYIGSGSSNGSSSGSSSGSVDISTFFRNETVIDIVNLYLWPLLHSRADEVVACKTFLEWQKLFQQTISLAFPDYEYWISVSSSKNGVPISDQRRTARILKYMTPARVLYLLTTRANIWPYIPATSSSEARPACGICYIKPKVKEYNNKTKIEWLVNADFLRKMKRVHMYFTSSFITSSNSSVYDTDECDE